jgi:hypothetical protein
MTMKKIYYLPGIISLLGLPVLLFIWGPPDPPDQTVLKLNLPSEKRASKGMIAFNNQYVYQMLSHKKITRVDLYNEWSVRGEQFLNSQQFIFIKREIERLQFTHDTTAALNIQFASNSTYGDFVWAINLAVLYEVKRYALVGNNLYFFANDPPPKPYEGTLGLSFNRPDYLPPEEHRWWEVWQTQLKYKWWWFQNCWSYLFDQQSQNRWLAAGFAVLVFVPGLFRLSRCSKEKQSHRTTAAAA